jgi:hypothetical protein
MSKRKLTANQDNFFIQSKKATEPKRLNLRTVYWIALALGICLTATYGFESYYTVFMTTFSNAFPPFIAGATVITAAFALKRYWGGLSSRLTQVWVCFAIGIFFWLLGELTWAMYALVLKVSIPYPSVADAFWLTGYAPILLAITAYLWLVKPAISKTVLATASTTALIMGILSSYFLIAPALMQETNITTKTIDAAYPILDFIMLTLAITGLIVLTKSRVSKSWVLFNIGILMIAIGDSLFSYTTAHNTYYAGHPLELFLHFGYILFILSFYIHTKTL